MKKYLPLLMVLCLLVSCSTDADDSFLPEESVQVSLEVTSPQVVVDQVLSMTLQSNEPLKQIKGITEHGIYTWEAFGNEDQSEIFTIYFKFPSPGTKTVNLEITLKNETLITKELSFEVERGNAVQLTKVEVNSFQHMGGSWDPEHGENDPERLADVAFHLQKLILSELNSEEGIPGDWFTSSIKNNEGELIWDLSEEELFLDPQLPFFFDLQDIDANHNPQDLLDRPRQIFLKDYIQTRPESISLIDAPNDLNVRFYLDWP